MLAGRFGDRAVIGVGTVTDAATAESAIKAGAQFVVSPVFDGQVVATARNTAGSSSPVALIADGNYAGVVGRRRMS